MPPEHAGAPVDRVLRALLGNVSWNVVRRCIESGKVYVDEERVLASTLPLRAGQQLELRVRSARVQAQSARPRLDPASLVHVDSQVVVVEKPAGIATVPFEGTERDTLDVLVADLVSRGQRRRPLHVVHRLDKETSGLLVFARTQDALRMLKNQFRVHSVDRRYLAVAHGQVTAGTHRSRLVTNRGDGRRGSTQHSALGRLAITHVEVVERLPGGRATWIACRLETGRTHQIRIHLAEAGHPLLGERVYGKGYRGELLTAPRVLLHAAELGFVHPQSGRRVFFESPLPQDFEAALAELRQVAPGARR